MIINNFIYRVYYSDATNGNIRVIETINYGSPWSSSTLIDDDATALITPQTSCSGERDVIYKDSESTPTIFHIADTFNFVRTQTDYLGLKDSVSKVVSRYRTILENLAFKDIIVKSKVISRLITEYLGIVGKTLLYHNYILNKYHRQKYPKQQIIINPEEYTMVWSDGFETGNFINWTYTNAMTIVTDPVYEGTYAAEFDGGYENAAYVEKVISSPQDHLYVEFWANFEGLAGGSEWRRVLEIYQDEDWLGNVRIQKKTDGWVLGLYDYWWNWHEGTTRLTTGWHKIKVYMTKGTGRAKIWLDDNLEVDTEVIHPDVQLTGFVIYVFDKYISEYYPRFTLDYVKCGI